MFFDQSISNFTNIVMGIWNTPDKIFRKIVILTIVFIQLPGAAEGCVAFSDRLVFVLNSKLFGIPG